MTGRICGKKIKKWGVRVLLVAGVFCTLLQFIKGKEDSTENNNRWLEYAALLLNRQMAQNSFLIQSYVEEGKRTDTIETVCSDLLYSQFPVISFYLRNAKEQPEVEDRLMAELFTAQEGTDEDVRNIDEESLDYDENALHIENSMLEEMEQENRRAKEQTQNPDEEEKDGSTGKEEFVIAEYPAYTYDWSETWDYEKLVSNFYAVDASTSLKEEYLDLDRLLEKDLSIDKKSEKPQILIYHTHSLESFVDSAEGDPSTTIVGAGERLAQILEQKYGFQVLHHTATYDEIREEAYERSLPEIEQLLEDNPSIEVVIDLHRDEMAKEHKLVMDLQGRPTARFMFFNGLSYTRSGGEISYLENPYIQDNLAFSFQAQVAANEYYPGIARKIYLKAYRYNMHLRPKCMLIELGAQNNTVEEIMNACDPLAHILAIVLDKML